MLRSGVMALALCAASPALAQTLAPGPGPGDPRIKEFLYDPNAIVAIRGQLGYELPIEFDPNERIENVSIGDSISWQATPNRKATMLFLKPMQKGNSTSMTVVTNLRIYSFLLTASEAKTSDPNQMLRLRFTYPQPILPPTPPPPPAPPAPRPEEFNFDYKQTGAKQLWPVRVFDDGKLTYFQFDPAKEAPAIFTLGNDDKEELAPTRMSGPYMVIDITAPKFVLRYGKAKADIANTGWMRRPAPAPAPLPQPSGG